MLFRGTDQETLTYCKIEVNKELSKIATTWRVEHGKLSHGVLIISVITS